MVSFIHWISNHHTYQTLSCWMGVSVINPAITSVMSEYPRYDKRPACSLSTVFRTCRAVHYALTIFVLDLLPHMYVSVFYYYPTPYTIPSQCVYRLTKIIALPRSFARVPVPSKWATKPRSFWQTTLLEQRRDHSLSRHRGIPSQWRRQRIRQFIATELWIRTTGRPRYHL